MYKRRIETGEKVKVFVEGEFKGQIVEVIDRKTSGHTFETSYRLNTTWQGKPYPAWFDRDEIESVQKEK